MSLTIGMLFLWVGLGVTTAVIAAAYGRDFFAWLGLGVLFGVFALIVVIALPKPDPKAANAGSPGAGNKECPKCHGHTIDWARKCKHCGHAFEGTEAVRPAA